MTRRLPANIEAERSLLGGLLHNSKDIHKLSLSPNDFFDKKHKLIYSLMLSLETIDLVTVSNAVMNSGKKELKISYITDLYDVVGDARHVEYYARIVSEMAARRRIIALGVELQARGFDRSQENVLEAARIALESIDDKILGDATPSSLKSILGEIWGILEQARENPGKVLGISSGLPLLDKYTGGWQRGDMVVVCGRPGTGKTALLLKFAEAAARRGNRVLIISAEMSQNQLVERMLAAATGIDTQTLRHGVRDNHDWAAVKRERERLENLPIDIVEGLYAINEVERIIRAHMPALVIVDYLQLLRVERRDSREQEVADISRRTKGIARQTGATAIVAAQLNRQVEYRNDKRPRLADLRDSGQIEQDADVILGIYREALYADPNSLEKVDEKRAEILLLKQRNGRTGIITVRFDPTCVSWYQSEPPF